MIWVFFFFFFLRLYRFISYFFLPTVSYFFGLFVSFEGIAVDFLLDFHLNSPSQSAKQVKWVSLNFSSSI